MLSQIILVTVEMATKWLAVPMVHQRQVSAHKARLYAWEMTHGKWRDHGAPIQLSENGGVVDGRHRLSAIVLCGIPREFVVVTGVSEGAFGVIDTHLQRRADQFIQGTQRQVVASTAVFLMTLERAGGLTPRRVDGFPIENVVEYVEKHPAIAEVVPVANRIRAAIGLIPTAHAAMLAVVGLDAGWVDGLENGVGLGPNDPRLVLRNRVIRDRTLSVRSTRERQLVTWNIAVKAWNAYITGRSVSLVRASATERVSLQLNPWKLWRPEPPEDEE